MMYHFIPAKRGTPQFESIGGRRMKNDLGCYTGRHFVQSRKELIISSSHLNI